MTDAAALASSVVNSPAAIARDSSPTAPATSARRFNRRQIEYDRTCPCGVAQAVRHKARHGGRVAILRSRDNGVYDPVPVVFENFFGEQRGFMARTFMVASRITARTFLKDRHLVVEIRSDDTQIGRSSPSSHYESGNCRQRHASRSPPPEAIVAEEPLGVTKNLRF